MRLILIEQAYDPHAVHISPHNISLVGDTGSHIVIRMLCGKTITTKFTDVQHAIDYIQRATTIKLTQE